MTVNIKELNPKVWKQKREALLDLLRFTDYKQLELRNIQRVSESKIMLQGCSLPLLYDMNTEEVTVWSKGGGRYASQSITVSQLEEVEYQLNQWSRYDVDFWGWRS